MNMLGWALRASLAIVGLLLCSCGLCQEQSPASTLVMRPIGTLVAGGVRGSQMVGQVFQRTFTSSNGIVLNQRDRRQCPMAGDSRFPCHGDWRRSPHRPESVHELRPGDIDIVGSIGDSLTAGTGALATNVFQVFTEYRGVSFCAGGDGNWTQYLTVPNIIKEFNPNLYGYSVGQHKIDQSVPPGGMPGDFFNVAVSGSEADNTIRQAKVLVAKMRSDPRVDFDRDWKLVTVLVGHNDICSHACDRFDPFSPIKDVTPYSYVKNIAKVLDILHNEMPRTFVNLMPIADVSIMKNIHIKPLPCVFTHAFGCPCMFDYKFSRPLSKAKVKRILNEYLMALEELVSSGRYDTHDDFTVVLQPTLVRGRVPYHKPRPGAKSQPNVDYLAPDCFHWAQKTHAMIARATWNNLLEPVGLKTLDYDKNVPFLCPTREFPYLATYRNSNWRNEESMQGLGEDFNQMMRELDGNVRCTL